jgi:thioredoxin 1
LTARARCPTSIAERHRSIAMSENTKAVTDQTFAAEVLGAAEPVLVDFWAEWCGPCRAVAPALDELGAEFKGRLTIAKVNIDENPMTPTQYGVRAIPTMILFKGGQPAATKMGALPKSQIRDWLSSSL